MKITIVQGAFLPVPALMGGAVEKMWYSLAKEFVAKGHEVTYISKRHTGLKDDENEKGIIHKRVKGFRTPSFGLLLKLLDFRYTLRALSQIPRDSNIIISNTFWLPILLKSSQQNICMADVARMPKGQMRFYKCLGRLRANSSPVAQAISAELNFQLPHKVTMIPNPLPFVNEFDFDFELKRNTILYTGRIHPEKGLDILVQAFATLKNSDDWKLLIVGPHQIDAGGGGERYLSQLKSMVKGTKVIFKGPIYDNKALNRYYEEASIFVYPSVAEKGETFGLSPLEAMSLGCATIVSDLACFKDFIRHGENGLCFDHRSMDRVDHLKSHLECLINNDSLRQYLAEAALKVRESHSTKKIADEFLCEFGNMQLNG